MNNAQSWIDDASVYPFNSEFSGPWIALDEIQEHGNLKNAIKAIRSDLADWQLDEILVADLEDSNGILQAFYSPRVNHLDIDGYLQFLSMIPDHLAHIPASAFSAWKDYGNDLDEENLERFADCYLGSFDYESEADNFIVESYLECIEIPDSLAGYIDEEKLARDLRIDSYWLAYAGEHYHLFYNQ